MPSPNADRDIEIERKYLLSAFPDHARAWPAIEIDQGYIPGDRIRERIRRSRTPDGVSYYRTMKAGSGIERLEIEEATTSEFFEAVWPLTRGARVQKRRYVVAEGALHWEIDEFLDRAGLWLAEVELERVDQQVTIPGWLDAVLVREVTMEPSYTNRALAK